MNRIQLIVFAFFLICVNVALAEETDCVSCHRDKTPAAVAQWEGSAHFAAKIGCHNCHGSDHERIVAGLERVDAALCGSCHTEEFKQHSGSRHGLGLHAGWGCTRNLKGRDENECRFCHEEGSTLPVSKVQCARLLKQSSEMGALGCNRCHQVENNCASCHSNHLNSSEISRDPRICAKCHMGPDHPQWEMWETSMHGTLYYSAGPEVGPTCQLCHMSGNTHDVSIGLTAPPSMKPFPDEELSARRQAMIDICSRCHAPGFARRELAAADKIREQSLVIVQEAIEVVEDINDRDLLDPRPADRPGHPQRGHVLVTDGQMLYEDYSHIERLLFKMKKFSLAKTVKGAYHQNPAYTHWYGNAELKMDLVDIRAEASRLRKSAVIPAARAENEAGSSVDKELKLLKRRFERGASFSAGKLGRLHPPGPLSGAQAEVYERTRATLLNAQVDAQSAPTPEVMALVAQREDARARGDWTAADDLRERIAAQGWQIGDTVEGPRLEPNQRDAV